MLNQVKSFLFNHTPLFDLINSVENHPSHKRGIFALIKFPFQRKGWQSRNEIDRVGLTDRNQFSFSQIVANINVSKFPVENDVS